MSVNAAMQLMKVVTLLESSQEPEVVKQNELFADDVQRLAKLHLKYIIFMMARNRIATYPFKDQNIKPILELIASIYALKEL